MSNQDEYHIVCANIRYLRKQYGLSRTAMARKLHITVKTLDLLERGIFPERINISLFFHVQQIFHIAPQRLLTVSLEEISPGPRQEGDFAYILPRKCRGGS